MKSRLFEKAMSSWYGADIKVLGIAAIFIGLSS
jgi:hypothetical protein